MVARPLQDIYPDFTQRQFNETPHQATTVLDGINVNVHGEAPGPLPEEVKREMLHTIKFRRPTNSQKKWTWTKLRIKNDTTLGRNGGQGTSHTSKSDVCAVVWLHYDTHWKSYVLRNWNFFLGSSRIQVKHPFRFLARWNRTLERGSDIRNKNNTCFSKASHDKLHFHDPFFKNSFTWTCF